MTVKVEGARRLRASLKKAGYDISEFRKVNKSAASTVAAFSKSTAPVRSGKLRSTIRAAGTNNAGIVRAGFKRVPYAGPIHWGWAKRNIEPQPWLSDTARATEPVWIQEYEQLMQAAIAQIKGK